MSYRNKKLLRAAKDQPCVLCGSVGTTIAAHANSVALGKGTGIKAPDYYTAWLCQYHHDMADGRIRLDSHWAGRREMWDWAYLKTVARWFELGIVVVK
jgi:hypothetical protein